MGAAGMATEEGAKWMAKKQMEEEAKKRRECGEFETAAARAGPRQGVAWRGKHFLPMGREVRAPTAAAARAGAVAVVLRWAKNSAETDPGRNL